MLRGLIDPAKEVEKLDKKRSALLVTIDKLRKAAEVEGDDSSFFDPFYCHTPVFRLFD
jgi:hypothetical protein